DLHELAARPHAGGRSGLAVPSPLTPSPTPAPKTRAQNRQYRCPPAPAKIPARVFSVPLRATIGAVRARFGRSASGRRLAEPGHHGCRTALDDLVHVGAEPARDGGNPPYG